LRTVLKHIVARTYKPLLEKYLSKTRSFVYEDIQLGIPPEVFHPGFFFSTRLLLKHVKKLPLKGKRFLEPGCGSGLISIYAARKNAIVTATDINPIALEYLKKNCRRNQVGLSMIESDVFDEMPSQQFDIIAINPPYYKKDPVTMKDYAWHCGANGEYFQKLFGQLNEFVYSGTETYMVLFDGCDIPMVETIAGANHFRLQCLATHENLLEKNYIFKIAKNMG
jgi:release factor glutamine methyltransferase